MHVPRTRPLKSLIDILTHPTMMLSFENETSNFQIVREILEDFLNRVSPYSTTIQSNSISE